jgi:glycosyltransferase involved in cell wall biosynthesis
LLEIKESYADIDSNSMRVDIVIPTFNSAGTLSRLVKSIETISAPYHIIIVDDASTDDTSQLCKQLQKQYNNITYLYNTVNAGVGAARNLALSSVALKGNYVYFIDADDWLTDGCIDVMLEEALKSESELIYGKVYTFDGSSYSEHSYNRKFFYKTRRLQSISEFPELMICPTLSNKLIKTALIRRLNLKFETKRYFAEDLHFSAKLCLEARGISIIDRHVINIQDLGSDGNRLSLWNTSSAERAWNTVSSIDDLQGYFIQHYPKYAQLNLYHSIYRLPRNLMYMATRASSEWEDYCRAIQNWLNNHEIKEIPTMYCGIGYTSVASFISIRLLDLILHGDFQLARSLSSQDDDAKNSLFSEFKKYKGVAWSIDKRSIIDSTWDSSHIHNTSEINKVMIPAVKVRLAQLLHYFKVSRSGLFDSDYYRDNYGSNLLANWFPLIHFLTIGGFRGNNPCSCFSSIAYYYSRPDSRRTFNPLVHFISAGVNEL